MMAELRGLTTGGMIGAGIPGMQGLNLGALGASGEPFTWLRVRGGVDRVGVGGYRALEVCNKGETSTQ